MTPAACEGYRGREIYIKITALQEIVWVFGRTWVVPKGVPSFVRRGAGR
jgi:chorismate-pyruvate lyase